MPDPDTPESQEGNGPPPSDPPAPPAASQPPEDWEKQVADLRKEAASYRTKLRSTEGELEKFRAAQMTEQEKAVAEAHKRGLAEGVSQANARLIRAEVISVAAGKVADPTDVVAILAEQGALADFTVDDTGNVDRRPIEAAIGELLKSKPHLAAVRDPSFGNREPVNGQGKGDDMNDWLRRAAHR